MARLWALMLVLVAAPQGMAGTVIVRDSREPFDAFAVRDAFKEQKAWQQTLANEQQIRILQALPVSCILVPSPRPEPRHQGHGGRDYQCGQHYYRPFQYQGRELYIGISPPSSGSQ
ncbi:hypothetical protein [Shewanella sp. NIFS-20-20]|uniref:hypothetical protein n=1 Tax=Shewanella sp. NIFS-20-20 TaxID=2853806 RepID=UPI001C48DD0C|nr:hypothetical protein [Shewanella sp. NIFS-20-20]MBV7314659.1 hypothetical protein [Shewanella sp. NIFS-20-20]